jgi:hypothetical protein
MKIVCALVALAIAATAAAPSAAAEGAGAQGVSRATRTLAPCTWSYFGDPRAVAHDAWVFTGCISTDGSAKLDQYNLESGERRLLTLFRGLEVDDHNNPSLVFFRSKLYAFVSEHAGYMFPLSRSNRMRYRVSRNDFGAGTAWGPTRKVPLGRGCGLGYTYPNPVVSGNRLYLFMRGPCWYPYFTSTTDGRHWTRPKTLVLGPPGRGETVRPYAKYDTAPDGSILMTFSDGHPGSYPNSLYYARFKNGRFYKANGTLIGTTRELPFKLSALDVVQKYSPSKGGPWPMDIVWGSDGAPAIVYSSRVGIDDNFRYARWNGARWVTRLIAPSGTPGLFGYRSGGITFNHADPSWIVLTRLIDGQYEIELRRTRNGGRTWRMFQLTRNSSVLNFRPVFPRGLDDADRLVVLYVSGVASSFRRYETVVNMLIDPRLTPEAAPQGAPTPAPGTAPRAPGGTPAPPQAAAGR